MHITHLRNATIIIHLGPHNILVDPMLAPKDALPPLRFFVRQRLRNPTVELPANTNALLETVTHCLITHCQKGHFDHLDRAAKRWLRERQTPVICTPHDVKHLRKRGLNVSALHDNHAQPQPFLGGTIRTIRCTHGLGLVGAMMEHGVGYFLEMPDEPSLYLSGDTILTDEVRHFVHHYQPDVCVVPAGGAHFDLGGDIIMGTNDLVELIRITKGYVVANHMEALSHCPVQREDLRRATDSAGLGGRLYIPQDGEQLKFECLKAAA
ncbi:MAG TPA: MBL fold metallo-hydrolase [Cellvibrio sp.]|nr:MBL fold metallo-hydrolase [Cellvibrio sp.]